MAEPELEPGELAELVHGRVRDPAPPAGPPEPRELARARSGPPARRSAAREASPSTYACSAETPESKNRRNAEAIVYACECRTAALGSYTSAKPARSTRRDHSWSSLIVRSSRNGKRSSTDRGTAALTFEKSVDSKRQLLAGREALGSGVRPVQEVEEELLGRSCVGVGELAAVRTGDLVRAAGRGGESHEPVLVGSDGVLRREDDEVARREPDPERCGCARGRTPRAGSRGRARPAPARETRSRRSEPESTTTTSTGSSTIWRAIASRQRTRSAPPFLTGMTTEITGTRRAGTGTRRARGARPRRRGRRAPRQAFRGAAPARCGRARRPDSRRPRPSRRGSRG